MKVIADDYTVRYVLFPISISALTAQDENGHYNIYINTALSEQNQLAALAHEVGHLVRNDFSSEKTLEETEPYRQSGTPQTSETIRHPDADSCVSSTERPTHVLTTGQLLQFMVSLENRKRKTAPLKRRHISIDIYKESNTRETG